MDLTKTKKACYLNIYLSIQFIIHVTCILLLISYYYLLVTVLGI